MRRAHGTLPRQAVRYGLLLDVVHDTEAAGAPEAAAANSPEDREKSAAAPG